MEDEGFHQLTTRTGGPKRRGFCKGDIGRHSCTADLPHYGPAHEFLVLGPTHRKLGLFSGQCCWTVHISAIVEDPKCTDERQAWGNCLPTKIAGDPPATYALHLTMRRISCVCGSLAIANWISSRFALCMLALRALPIRNT